MAFVKNCRRCSKNVLVDPRRYLEDSSKVQMEESMHQQEQQSKAYEVYKPRTTPLRLMKYSINNEVQQFRENTRQQHLQPSLLPKYFSNKTDFTNIDPKTNYDGRMK